MESPGHVYTKNLHYDELQQFNSVCKPCPNIVSSIVFFKETHYAVANFCLGHNSTFEKTFEFF